MNNQTEIKEVVVAKTVDLNLSKLINRIREKFHWAAYSPGLDMLVFIDGGKSELVDSADNHVEFFYTYEDEDMCGKHMHAELFERDYTIYWDINE